MQFEIGIVDQAARSAIDNEIIFLTSTIPQVRVTRHMLFYNFKKCSKSSVAHTKAEEKKAENFEFVLFLYIRYEHNIMHICSYMKVNHRLIADSTD